MTKGKTKRKFITWSLHPRKAHLRFTVLTGTMKEFPLTIHNCAFVPRNSMETRRQCYILHGTQSNREQKSLI